MNGKSCCAPSGDRKSEPVEARDLGQSPKVGSKEGMMALEGGPFLMGGEDSEVWGADGEGPTREVTLDPFWIDQTTVTNDAFSEFVDATGYETEAERYGWSFVFYNQIPKGHRKHVQFTSVEGTSWWARLDKANWRKPGGPGTNTNRLGDHPVVHVSWQDSVAYTVWAGKRLPTEAEWEYASRGGLENKIYPWGDVLMPEGKHRCNIWQGQFPQNDTAEDGYASTAPAKSFRANGYGLYHCVGNVWEWTADWFSPDWHHTGPRQNPKGPDAGRSRVIKGGSYLCHESYCNRYRNSARTKNTPESSTGHTGFRCVISS